MMANGRRRVFEIDVAASARWLVLMSIAVVVAKAAMAVQATDRFAREHENTEWSISYGFHLTDKNKSLPRVLLVGDSICNGYQGEVAKNLDGRVNVSYWVSSHCLTSPGYMRLLEFHLDEAHYDVIHFNNGLHSLGTPTEAWAKSLRDAFALIRIKQPKAKLIWASSTPVRIENRVGKVRELNAAAAPIAAEFGCRTNDLHAFADPYDRETHWSDAYHHKRPLRDAMARRVADVVLDSL